MKVSIFRQTADGEQVNVEMQVSDGVRRNAEEGKTDQLDRQMAVGFHVVDRRLIEMNRRIVAAKAIVATYPADVRMKVNEVVNIILGNVPQAELERLLKEAQEKGQAVDPADQDSERADVAAIAEAAGVVEPVPVEETAELAEGSVVGEVVPE